MLNKFFPKGSKNREWLQNSYYNWLVPKSLSKNFRSLDESKTAALKASFFRNIFAGSNINDDEKKAHFTTLQKRHKDHQIKIIPWLNSVCQLKDKKILEIGCGNGTSTVALAEQGAVVTAIDIDANLLNDAIERCKTYDLQVEFHLMNAVDVGNFLAHNKYDMIIFYAVLEHMTYSERLSAIKTTYEMLSKGGFWAVIDTPNRLHFYDSHTAMMPFFHWLPDELAIQYSQFSSRDAFKTSFEKMEIDEAKKLEFLRWGRGMSFHEFELSLMPIHQLKIVSTLSSFLIKRSIFYHLLDSFSANNQYAAFLKKRYPTIHLGFFQPFLNIIIQKS